MEEARKPLFWGKVQGLGSSCPMASNSSVKQEATLSTEREGNEQGV